MRLLLFMGMVLSLLDVGCHPAASGPPNSQTLRIPISSEPPTLDWTLATDNVSIRIIENLMEGLTAFDPQLRPVPALARGWEVSPDGKRYLFHLREDVYWSDGVPVRAQDFEYAWKRLLDPETGAEYAYFLYVIENAYEYNTGRIRDPDRVGVRALDDHTLEVRLKRPIVFFPSITTFVVTYPLRQDIVERYGSRWTEPEHLVVNGPFSLESWRHEYRVTLRANPRYYRGRPALDRIVFYVVPEPTTALTLYETGDLDLVSLPPVAIPRYRHHPDYIRVPFLRGYYYGFNVKKPPFDDVRVRRAFALAIDRSRIPEILKGGEIPTTSWIPPGMFGYNPDIGLPFNPQEARRLLAAAGYPEGRGFPEVEAVFNSGMENRLIAEFLQEQWRRHLGVRVRLRNMEWKVYLKQLQVDPPALYRLGWGADYPDPDNFMNLFTSTSGNNHTQWGDSRYDALIEAAAVERDPQRRKALYDEAQRLLTEEAVPIIPLFAAAQNRLVKPYVRGLHLNAMDILYLKDVWIQRPQIPQQPWRGS